MFDRDDFFDDIRENSHIAGKIFLDVKSTFESYSDGINPDAPLDEIINDGLSGRIKVGIQGLYKGEYDLLKSKGADLRIILERIKKQYSEIASKFNPRDWLYGKTKSGLLTITDFRFGKYFTCLHGSIRGLGLQENEAMVSVLYCINQVVMGEINEDAPLVREGNFAVRMIPRYKLTENGVECMGNLYNPGRHGIY